MSRRSAVTVAGVAVVAVAAGGGWYVDQRPDQTGAPRHVQTAIATVTRTSLASTGELSGTIGFRGAYQVVPQATGTLTWLPASGATIRRNQPLLEIDDHPVRLLYGRRPAHRAFEVGMTSGPDVRQLERNLVALGYLTTADDEFTWWTAEAVEAWQRDTDQTVTGRIELGAIAFLPGAVRISSVPAVLGAAPEPGSPALTATSVEPVVNVMVEPDQAYLMRPGTHVRVVLPDQSSVSGHVGSLASSVSPAAGPTEGPDSGDSGPGAIAGVVELDHHARARGRDGTPVLVEVTQQTARNVLAVPVTALVALAEGGYGVYRVDRSDRELVAVTLGLFADSMVQVKTGLRAGDKVEVPAP